MPAGDFTASVMPDILLEMENIFTGSTPVQCEFEHPVMTAKLLLERQSVSTVPILEGSTCKGVKAWFLQAGTSTIAHSGTSTRSTADCNFATPVQMQTNSKTYNNNIYAEAVVRVDDAKCDNMLTFSRESAVAILKGMQDLRKDLNTRGLALLSANVQPHQAATSVDATIVTGNYTGNVNSWKIAPTGFDYTALTEMAYIKTQEQIKNSVVLNVGRNFWSNERIAFYKTITSDDNFKGAIYNGEDIHWDIEGKQSLATPRDTTFVFSPDTILFWNTTIRENEEPVQIDPSRNRWAYKMQDPELMYRKDGQLVPVEYDVRYEFSCSGRTSNGEEIFQHIYEITLTGGLDVAPAGFNRASTPVAELTGIIEFVAEV